MKCPEFNTACNRHKACTASLSRMSIDEGGNAGTKGALVKCVEEGFHLAVLVAKLVCA